MKLVMTNRQQGFSLIEILISLVVIAVGLLGLASLQSKAQVSELEAYQRAQALLILTDIVDTLQANKVTASCFRITNNLAAGTPYIGVDYNGTPACAAGTGAQNAQAIAALQRIDGILDGSAETITESGITTQLGAMIGARACISYDAATAIVNNAGVALADTGEYTIAVSWQGMVPLFDIQSATAPAINCGRNLYGNPRLRRVVSTQIRLAQLN